MEEKKVTIHAISDHTNTVSSNFDVKIYSYESMTPKYQKNFQFTIDALTAKPVVSIDLDEIKKQSGCEANTAKSCVLILTSNDNLFEHKDFINFLLFKIRLADVTNLRTPSLSVVDVQKKV